MIQCSLLFLAPDKLSAWLKVRQCRAMHNWSLKVLPVTKQLYALARLRYSHTMGTFLVTSKKVFYRQTHYHQSFLFMCVWKLKEWMLDFYFKRDYGVLIRVIFIRLAITIRKWENNLPRFEPRSFQSRKIHLQIVDVLMKM